MKRGVFSSFIYFSAGIATFIIAFFYFFNYTGPQKKLLVRGLYEKTAAVVLAASSGIEKALKNDDDISLFSQVEIIKRVEDVRSVYILDAGGRVVSHDKIDEWGKIYDKKALKKAIESRKTLWQNLGSGGFIYSSPLPSSSTLCIEISPERIRGKIASAKKNGYYSGAAMLVFSVFVFASFAYYRIAVPFRELEHVLRMMVSGAAGKIEVKRKDEFGNIHQLLNDLIAFRGAGSSGTTQSGYSELFEAALEQCDYGIAVIDSENKVAAINSRAKNLLKLGAENNRGKHILDVFKSPLFLNALQRAVSEKTVEAVIDNFKIKVTAAINGVIVVIFPTTSPRP